MRKVWFIFITFFLCIDVANAASRVKNTSVVRQTSGRSETTASRNSTIQVVNPRSATTQTRQNNARNTNTKTTQTRSAIRQNMPTRLSVTPLARVSRAASTTATSRPQTTYDSCRDAYFTCMDQFCATQNDTYRRCVCSSKLSSIQNQEKILSQTSDSLKTFEDINIDAISKTTDEVKAMSSATEGEKAKKKDESNSAIALKNISDILNKSKNQALTTQGTLDIANKLKSAWMTNDFIVGTDIANLTGESLFNAVHAQCFDMLSQTCSASNLKMASSAYGMYIENDCALLEGNLKNKKVVANAAIMATRHKMQETRLENYDAHNSLNINDCIAKVRSDMTSDAVCGEGYIHCLDFSGKYLNAATGEPIYSPEFYQLKNQLSLTGDVLKNKQNSTFIITLNNKRALVEKNLDLCKDNSDDVWNEFLRQAIVEIYQNQNKRVENVKNECLQVVNECYLKNSEALKNFTGNVSSMTFVQAMELTEEMCTDKLNTCSKLYGGGQEGLNTLIATITNLTIEQSCSQLLSEFAKSLCAVPNTDSEHSYPYGCRVYSPGERYYANKAECNNPSSINPYSQSDILIEPSIIPKFYLERCQPSGAQRIYTSCKPGFYLSSVENINQCKDTINYCYTSNNALACLKCPDNYFCFGQNIKPQNTNSNTTDGANCGVNYIGSVYHQFVRYALQNCTRTNKNTYVLSESLLIEIDKVVQGIRTDLAKSLSQECTKHNGIWVDSMWVDENSDGRNDKNNDTLLNTFYRNTGANKQWGYCKTP